MPLVAADRRASAASRFFPFRLSRLASAFDAATAAASTALAASRSSILAPAVTESGSEHRLKLVTNLVGRAQARTVLSAT